MFVLSLTTTGMGIYGPQNLKALLHKNVWSKKNIESSVSHKLSRQPFLFNPNPRGQGP